jgi:hypothetical protein
MLVPETSMYKHYCSVLWQNDVWIARQVTAMNSET